MFRSLLILCLLVLTTLGIASPDQYAQTDCTLAETIAYPFDVNEYQLAQDFGVPSPRHQGRYHTGEDWFLDRDNTLGQPVRAAAPGRVTYAYPLGWGRDGGVVIIEHTFMDGSVIYTQYGHMMETDSIKFPRRLSCVETGDIIGAIGNARPAPHLHFEVRTRGGDFPGPGYSWVNPLDDVWLSPEDYMQAWAR